MRLDPSSLEVEPADRPPRRWPIGRVASDLPIAVFVASMTRSLLAPLAPGICGHTMERDLATISGLALLARPWWRVLKALNDLAERWLGVLNRPEP